MIDFLFLWQRWPPTHTGMHQNVRFCRNRSKWGIVTFMSFLKCLTAVSCNWKLEYTKSASWFIIQNWALAEHMPMNTHTHPHRVITSMKVKIFRLKEKCGENKEREVDSYDVHTIELLRFFLAVCRGREVKTRKETSSNNRNGLFGTPHDLDHHIS